MAATQGGLGKVSFSDGPTEKVSEARKKPVDPNLSALCTRSDAARRDLHAPPCSYSLDIGPGDRVDRPGLESNRLTIGSWNLGPTDHGDGDLYLTAAASPARGDPDMPLQVLICHVTQRQPRIDDRWR
jgi:hypothetical protein